MPRVLVLVASALMIGLGPSAGMANEQGAPSGEGAAAGAVTGAVAGAVIGGPVGAVIGAVVGGVAGNAAVGAASAGNEEAAQSPSSGPAQPTVVVPSGSSGRALLQDPETTGTIVQQRTCVREADGRATCRIVR